MFIIFMQKLWVLAFKEPQRRGSRMKVNIRTTNQMGVLEMQVGGYESISCIETNI